MSAARHYHSEKDIAGLRKVGRAVTHALMELVHLIRPGINMLELDRKAGEVLEAFGARSAPRLLEGFPGNVCISLNEIIAHGVPHNRILRCGDFINIDVSAELDGYFGDVGYSLVLGEFNDHLSRLCDCAKRATMRAIGESVAGKSIKEIARIIENEARADGYTVLRNLCSHGVGKSLHSYPQNIKNYYDPDEEDLCLEEGMVIAWEPYISSGACRAMESDDGWSLTTHDKSRVAQFEHTVLVTSGRPEIITVLS